MESVKKRSYLQKLSSNEIHSHDDTPEKCAATDVIKQNNIYSLPIPRSHIDFRDGSDFVFSCNLNEGVAMYPNTEDIYTTEVNEIVDTDFTIPLSPFRNNNPVVTKHISPSTRIINPFMQSPAPTPTPSLNAKESHNHHHRNSVTGTSSSSSPSPIISPTLSRLNKSLPSRDFTENLNASIIRSPSRLQRHIPRFHNTSLGYHQMLQSITTSSTSSSSNSIAKTPFNILLPHNTVVSEDDDEDNTSCIVLRKESKTSLKRKFT